MYEPLVAKSFFTNWTYVKFCHEDTLRFVVHPLLLHLQMLRVKQPFENLRSPLCVQVILQADFQEAFYSTDRNGVR